MDKAFLFGFFGASKFVSLFILVSSTTYNIMKTIKPNFFTLKHFIKRKKNHDLIIIFLFKDIIRAVETRDNKII